MPYSFSSPLNRVILDTDAKNEADDQFAIVHALLSPSLDIRGIIPAHFGTRLPDSMELSRGEVDHLLSLLDLSGSIRVENGAPVALTDPYTPVDSPGARLIIEEAQREDAGPLTIGFLGPLTDMGSAILLEPRIIQRDVLVIWIGGPPYNGVRPFWWPEFNLMNDRHAANVVLGSGIHVIQVPMNVYMQLCVSYAELDRRVRPAGALGAYLCDQIVSFNEAGDYAMEFRSLGDSPTVGLMLSPHCASVRTYPVRRYDDNFALAEGVPDRTVDVVEALDVRFILEDMFAKLASVPG